MFFIFILLPACVSLVLLVYLRYKYTYWHSRGVKQLKTHFLFGNLLHVNSVHLSDLLHEIYSTFKNCTQIAGAYIFTKPIAVVLDLDLAKSILIKDFNKFCDRNKIVNDDKDPLSGHLFNMHDEKWRSLRAKLTPTFTSGKMKFMFPTIVSVAKQLELTFAELVANSSGGIVELHDIMGRYTTDIIANCAFGLECNSLKEPDVEFRHVGHRFFYCNNSNVHWRIFKVNNLKLLSWFGLKGIKPDITEFMMRVVRDTVRMREKQHIQRKDFLNLLIELRNSKDMNGMPCLSIEQVAAQVFLFFIAGFETSSSNMSYGLFELARNPLVQERLRTEITEVLERYSGQLTYEAMMEMTYLDQTITETLRKYPALSAITRVAIEDFTIPGTTTTLEKGTTVYIPAKEIHYDPEIYENPHEFNPDRFSSEEMKRRHPQAFLGFGDGPRNCIGLRFGRMQVRVGLIMLLKSFRFSVSARTPEELELSKYSLVIVPGGDGVWVKAERL